MAHTDTRIWHAERALQSSVDTARKSDTAFNFSDDDFDFPPTPNPGRELFTFSLVVLLIMALAVWVVGS
jgi:hypothetical protein